MKTIPVKNYVILSLILLLTFGFIYYFYLWYTAYDKNTLESSILDQYIQVINYNEIDNYIVENQNVYIYVSVLNDKKIREFELNFKNSIIKNNLKNEILYLDVTDEISSNNTLKYNLSMDKMPCILIFSAGELVDTYNIKSSGYSPSKTLAFLVSKDVYEK